MELRIYAIFDEKALSYGTPFFAPTDGIAVRMFTDLCNDPRSTVAKYPKDFRLYWIGTYTDNDARLLENETATFIMHATEAAQQITYPLNNEAPLYADSENTYVEDPEDA